MKKFLLYFVLIFSCFIGNVKFCYASILFADNFSGNLNNWNVVTGTWNIQNNELCGIGAGGSIDAWIYAGNKSWTDYEFETDIKFIDGNAEMVFRSTEHWKNEYRFTFFSQNSPYRPNNFVAQKYKNGVTTSLNKDNYGDLSPVALVDNINAKVSISGNNIKIFVNGGKIFDYDDSDSLTNGQIGLGVIWEWKGKFDNVLVSDNNVNTVPEPATLSLFGLGVIGLLLRRNK